MTRGPGIIRPREHARPVIGWDKVSRPPTPAELALAREFSDVLMRHYPGHPWAVTVDAEQGIAIIQNLSATIVPGSRGHYGYILRLAEVDGDPTFRAVMRAGGEILERYSLAREGYTPGVYERAKYVG